ncbi:unnamed protein product [Ambrosiozyma monospora]|uniref:Unnamed protein product n=1 Tax=Ambrosiozyma monospora TaxID=43982 RepID=A0A9W7DDQ9_AMBMO|nr:unnamed protein product [Ambrosiozyma monospora]
MKRPFSDQDIENGKAKISKLTNDLIGYFGWKKPTTGSIHLKPFFPLQQQQQGNSSGISNISNFSTASGSGSGRRPMMSSKSRITARQLKEVYERSMRGDDSALKLLMKNRSYSMNDDYTASGFGYGYGYDNDNCTNLADKTILPEESDKENDTMSNNTVNVSKRPQLPELSEKSITVESPTKKMKTNGSVAVPVSVSHRPEFRINPLERAKLIQLKKRMESNRYRKSKTNIIRSHIGTPFAQIPNGFTSTSSSSSTSTSTSPLKQSHTQTKSKYVESSTDTNSNGHSVSNVQKGANTTVNLDEIPEEKKNRDGWFTVDPYVSDTEDDIGLDNAPVGKIDEGKPLISKIKFNSKTSSTSSSFGFNTAARPKSFVPTKDDYAKVASFVSEKKNKDMNESNSKAATNGKETGSVGGGKTATVADVTDIDDEKIDTTSVPTAGFTFGVKPASKTTSTDSTKKINGSGFSFGVAKSKNNVDSEKPKISFGVSSSEKKSSTAPPSFGSKPLSFSLSGNNATKENSTTTTSATIAAPKLSFGLGGSSSSTTSESSTSKKPAAFSFSLGGKKDEPAKTGFGFGSTKPSPSPVPSFSLDNKSASPDKPTEKKSTPFTFGGVSSTTAEKKPDSVPQFSFGTKPTKTESKPLSFGTAASTGATKPLSFSFGTATSDAKETKAPTFSLGGSSNEGSKSTTPAFSFGTKPAANPTSASSEKPAFSFGTSTEKQNPASAPATKPFSFGTSTGSKDDTSKPASTFGGFGTQSEKKDDTPKPTGFSGFGTGSATTTNTSDNKSTAKPFTFGTGSSEKKDEPSTATSSKPAAFSFGSSALKSHAPKPSVSFGGFNSNDKKGTGSAFSLDAVAEKKESTAPPSFSFGTGSATGAGAPKSSSSTPAFNFGTGAGSTAEKKADTVSKPFSFGGAAATGGFGSSTATGFGTSSSSTTGFGTSAATATADNKNDPSKKLNFSLGTTGSAPASGTQTPSKPALSTSSSTFSFGGFNATKNDQNGTTTPNNNASASGSGSAFNLDASKIAASAFGENKSSNNNNSTTTPVFSFGSSNNNNNNNSTPSLRPKSAGATFGGNTSSTFNFGTGAGAASKTTNGLSFTRPLSAGAATAGSSLSNGGLNNNNSNSAFGFWY